MAHRFDATPKDIVADHPDDFARVFGLPVEGPVTALSVDLSTISAATDVALGFGQPVRHVVDLNFQSGPDVGLPARLHLYNAALHSRHGVTVQLILILLRKKADAAEWTGRMTYGERDGRVEFGYRVIRLWQEPVESDRRLRGVENRAEAIRLMTASYILTGLRVAKSDLASIDQGIGLMQESTAFDEAIEEGELRGKIDILLRMGRKRFGVSEANADGKLAAIRDLDRLDRLADSILSVDSWQELLETP